MARSSPAARVPAVDPDQLSIPLATVVRCAVPGCRNTWKAPLERGSGRPRRYCSDACRTVANRQRRDEEQRAEREAEERIRVADATVRWEQARQLLARPDVQEWFAVRRAARIGSGAWENPSVGDVEAVAAVLDRIGRGGRMESIVTVARPDILGRTVSAHPALTGAWRGDDLDEDGDDLDDEDDGE